MHVCHMSVWRSEDSLWELVHSFYHLGSEDQSQVVRFNKSKGLDLLSHPSHPLDMLLPCVPALNPRYFN